MEQYAASQRMPCTTMGPLKTEPTHPTGHPPVGYLLHLDPAQLPEPVGQFYDYILAANGVYFRPRQHQAFRRAILPVAMVLAHPGAIRGLVPLAPGIELAYPRVPVAILLDILSWAYRWLWHPRGPFEMLVHLRFDEDTWSWRWCQPAQVRSATHCQATQTGPDSSHGQALIELHSHHWMRPCFSPTDTADEAQGCRIYAVLGSLTHRPTLTVRVGMSGHFLAVPAGTIFEMPGWLGTAPLESHVESHAGTATTALTGGAA